jgi:hypothetical protein
MRQLKLFPLGPTDKVGDMTDGLKKLMKAYIKFRSPGAPELVDIFELIWTEHP